MAGKLSRPRDKTARHPVLEVPYSSGKQVKDGRGNGTGEFRQGFHLIFFEAKESILALFFPFFTFFFVKTV